MPMIFKTIEGARKRAAFENAYAEGKRKYRTVENANSHQRASGYAWRVERMTKADIAADRKERGQ